MKISQYIYLQLRSAHDKIFDWRLGIDTFSYHFKNPKFKSIPDRSHYGDSAAYASVPYSILTNFLNHIDIGEDIVFDIGCGPGRILCCFARMRVKKVVGIEISRELGKMAEVNLSKLRGRRSKYEIQIIDACKADYSDGTIYVFFSPFGSDTLVVVLDRIMASLKKNPRKIQILYISGHSYLGNADIIGNQSWLKMIGQYRYALAPRWKASCYINTGT